MAPDDRRQEILDVLYKRRSETMSNLAHEFGVTRQTILADINRLSLSHPEIVVRSGRYGGGVYIESGFRSDRRGLMPDERELLMKLRDTLQGKDKAVMERLLQRMTA